VLNLEGAEIKGNIYLKSLARDAKVLAKFNAGGIVNLTGVSAGTLTDAQPDWPSELRLEGFVYKSISRADRGKNDPMESARRLQWLKLDRSKPVPTQPYRQLAKVFQDTGDRQGAKTVLREMERILSDQSDPLPKNLLWSTIGYGYASENGVWGLAALSGLGWIVYRRRLLQMVPTDKDAARQFEDESTLPTHYPRFSPFIYSLENTFPLVTLGQAAAWHANPGFRMKKNPHDGPKLRFLKWWRSPYPLRLLVWLQVLLGWLFATLFVAGVSGLIQRS
jgi:hypothetical protein